LFNEPFPAFERRRRPRHGRDWHEDAIGRQTLFAGDAWFDPIEAGIRDRVRGFIEELLKQELTAALGRTRHERAEGAPAGYRNGARKRQLLGSFG